MLAQAPNDFRALLGKASVHYGAGQVDKALADYGDIMAKYPDEAQPFNDCAWLLATGTKDALRSGDRAVELADKACKLTEYKNSAYLDTLAAAFAEKGDFEQRSQMAARSGKAFRSGAGRRADGAKVPNRSLRAEEAVSGRAEVTELRFIDPLRFGAPCA